MNNKFVIIGITLFLMSLNLGGCNEIQNSPDEKETNLLELGKAHTKI